MTRHETTARRERGTATPALTTVSGSMPRNHTHCAERHYEDTQRMRHDSDRSHAKNPGRMSDPNVKIGLTET